MDPEITTPNTSFAKAERIAIKVYGWASTHRVAAGLICGTMIGLALPLVVRWVF